jgi:hypothetical protein
MLTRTLVTLTLPLAPTNSPDPASSPTAHPDRLGHARLVDDLEGCQVAPPSPEPAAPASCNDQGQP